MHNDAVRLIAAWLPAVDRARLAPAVAPAVWRNVAAAAPWDLGTIAETVAVQRLLPRALWVAGVQPHLRQAVMVPETDVLLAGPLPSLRHLTVNGVSLPDHLAARAPRLEALVLDTDLWCRPAAFQIPPSVRTLYLCQLGLDICPNNNVETALLRVPFCDMMMPAYNFSRICPKLRTLITTRAELDSVVFPEYPATLERIVVVSDEPARPGGVILGTRVKIRQTSDDLLAHPTNWLLPGGTPRRCTTTQYV